MVEVPTSAELNAIAADLSARIQVLEAGSLPAMPDAVKQNLINILTNLPPVLEWLKQALQPAAPP